MRGLSISFGRLLALVCGAGLWLALPATAQRGAMVMPQNLAELVDEAGTIVRGHIVSAHVEPHPELTNLTTVVVTVKVETALKGDPAQTFSFRQYLWDIRDKHNATGHRKGQRVLLLLTKPSEYGLSSPAGLEQGRFLITTEADGKPAAVNGVGNAGLFRNLKPVLEKRGVSLPAPLAARVEAERAEPIPLNELEELIRSLVKNP